MFRTCFFIAVFVFIAACMFAATEAEPNNNPDDVNVLWAENGTHYGNFNYPGDVDVWHFYGFPDDQVTVSTLGQTTLDTVIEIRNSAGEIVAMNDDYNSTYQSYVTYTVPDDAQYFIFIREYFNQPGSYSFTVSGLFISLSSVPNAPFNINIPDGATGVDPNVSYLAWTWGDGCCLGSWNLLFGVSEASMQMLNMFPQTVLARRDSIAIPAPLLGGFTYYYQFVITLNGVSYGTAPYAFTVATISIPLPFVEDFNNPAYYQFGSVSTGNGWANFALETGNPGSMLSIPEPGVSSYLIESGTHDLSQTTGAYMSFRHIALLEANGDQGYVEFSPDGGITWEVFPASSYLGSGIYDVPMIGEALGPCFDAGSYPAWLSYSPESQISDLWRTETFDLTPWAASTAFRVRFRAVYDNNPSGTAWVIDDFTIQQNPASIPASPSPATTSVENNTNLRLSWQAINASGYDIAFGTNPANLSSHYTSQPYWDALNLNPYTTYYWKVRSRNAFGSSKWSTLWSFSTQQYATPWHLNSSLYINRVQFETIDNTSSWNGYTNNASLSTPAQCGLPLPISVHLTGGFGPEAVRVWIDINRDAVFSNSPADGEYWDIPWGNGCFQGNIQLPANLSASPTRMRIQAIHSTTDVLAPSGLFQYGETEDYLLLTADSPILHVTPLVANFPETLAGFASEPQAFTFSNHGGQILDITLTGITGPESGAFTLTEANAYPIHLTNNSASVDIRFLPQNPGLHNAYLLVRDNLSRQDHLYPLSGMGIGSRPDGALAFDGSGEYASIASAPALQNLSQFTLELWFKWEGGSAIQFLTAKNYEELEIHTNGNNSSIRFIPTTGVYIDSQPGVLQTGQWQHLACVYNPALSLARMYLDGVDVTWQNNGYNPLSTPVQNSSASFKLGIRAGSTYPLNGCLDELRIWNNSRSQAEIIANKNLNQSSASPGLTAYWKFDELSGNRIYEQIQGLHGYLINMEPEDRIASGVVLVSGLSAPQDVSISELGANIRIQWSPVSGASAYRIFSAQSPEGPYNQDSSGTFNACSWTAPSAANTRFYKVSAILE